MSFKVISGGQTGVDRAGLDAAYDIGVATGGFCTSDRRAEDGLIPSRYNLSTVASTDYRVRTRANIEAADFTLILNRGELTGGTRFTHSVCMKLEAKMHHTNFEPFDPVVFPQVHNRHGVHAGYIFDTLHRRLPNLGGSLVDFTLNIAGPRESKFPGIYHDAYGLCLVLFQLLKQYRGEE